MFTLCALNLTNACADEPDKKSEEAQ